MKTRTTLGGCDMTLRLLRVRGRDFVAAVQALGGSERDGKRLWARIVSSETGSRHGLQTGYAESLTAGRLTEIAAAEPQLQHLKEGDWQLVTGAVAALVPVA